MLFTPCRSLLLLTAFSPLVSSAHESFLPLHHHSSSHEHTAHAGIHTHREPDGKHVHEHSATALTEERFAFAAGARFTRYSVPDAKAQLWETGVGIDFAVRPWLHVGGDIAYGWFESGRTKVDGWLSPHAHLDLHLPVGGAWEVVAGLDVGLPFGDEALVGEHWEWAPHVELRYDRGGWYAEAEASLAFIKEKGEHDHHAEEEGDTHEGEHEHSMDVPEIVEPHGERELRYGLAAGVRLLDRRLTLESRLTGIHILAGETPEDDYLRTGVRVSWAFDHRWLLSAEGTVPITDAERNQWQASVGLRVGF
jgi:hypothetical protein